METTVFVFRIIFLVMASVVALIYFLFQLYQKLPCGKFALATTDHVVFVVVALMFGFGSNSYFALLAFLPLLVLKFLCKKWIVPSKLSGSGWWMEINWRKLTPRGFERNVPKAVLDEMNKVPKDAHFIIPRFYMHIFLHFITKRMGSEMKKPRVAELSKTQQQAALDQVSTIIENVVKLEKGKTEKKDFPFGVLRVTRH